MTQLSDTVFRLRKSNAVFMLCIMLIVLAEVVLAAFGVLPLSLNAVHIALAAAFLLLSLGITLDTLLTRLTINNEGLTYRTLFERKELRWEQVESARKGQDAYRREIVELSGAGVHIKIDTRFQYYNRIRDVVMERCPDGSILENIQSK